MSIKGMLGIAGFTVTLLAQAVFAGNAELRYIRMGEHSDYTRLVFEFSQLPTYEDPVVPEEGKVSMVFSDTSTVLPTEIPGETTKRIESLKFLQQGRRLIADLRVSFPRPKLTIFSLSDPPRIVLDIRPVDLRAEDVPEDLLSDNMEPAESPNPTDGSTGRPKMQQSAKTVTSPSETTAAFTPDPSVSETKTAVNIQKTETAQGKHKRWVDARFREGQIMEAGNVPEKGLSRSWGSGAHLQTYLLAALTVLSATIVALLFALVHKKRAIPYKGDLLESDRATGEKIARIDIKIDDELEKFSQR